MKFTFIAPRFHTNLYYPIKVLLDNNHQVDFLALYKGQSESHDLVKPIILGCSKYRLPSIWLFLKSIRSSYADVLIIKDIVTPYSIMALIVGFLLRKKMVVLTQIPKFRPKIESGSVKWLWRIFRIYALTPVLGDRNFSNQNHNLIYTPFVIPADSKIRSYFQQDDVITILCVGKFQFRKNQLLLIKAINDLRNKFSINLWLSGQEDEEDYLEQVKDYIKNNRLESVVKIFPHRSWDKMKDLYRQVDLFVLPSFAESAAYSILEAMSFGLPVISSDDNGTKWYIEEGVNGYIFNHTDRDDLKIKLESIIKDRDKLVNMGQASLDLVATKYQPTIFYKHLMDIIDNKCYSHNHD